MKPTNNGYNIAGKQRKMPKGVPFVKGDSRCWREGRPRSFDQLRALAQAIAGGNHRERQNNDKSRGYASDMVCQ
jgi:ribosomal protein S14